MNISEGARRIQRAGRWICLVSTSLAALLGVLATIISYFRIGIFIPATGVVVVYLMSFIFVPGAVLRLAGWILEGFAKTAS